MKRWLLALGGLLVAGALGLPAPARCQECEPTGDPPAAPGKVRGCVFGHSTAGREVRLWMDGAPETRLTGQANAGKLYEHGLGEGGWWSSACTAPPGYEPSLWWIRVDGGRLRELAPSRAAPFVFPEDVPASVKLGAHVTLSGLGLWCAGKIVVDYPATADSGSDLSTALGEQIEVTTLQFNHVEGKETVTFTLQRPPGAPTSGTAVITYVRGMHRSVPVAVRYE